MGDHGCLQNWGHKEPFPAALAKKKWGKIPWEVTILSEGNPTKSEPSLKRVESPELMEWTIPLWYMFQTYRIKALIVGKYLSNGTGMLHRVAKGDQFLPEWSNPNGTLLDREVAAA